MEIEGYQIAFGGFPFVRHQVGPLFPRILSETGLLDTGADLKILCMHQSVDGARVGPVGFTFRKGRDVIGLDQLPPEIPLVLSGHIHRQQILQTAGMSRIVYPGSIERTSFAEKDERKGFYLINIRMAQPPVFEFEFIDLQARTMVDVRLPLDLADRQSAMDYIVDRSTEVPVDSILRIIPQDEDQAKWISAPVLREILPDTMNVEISRPGTGRLP